MKKIWIIWTDSLIDNPAIIDKRALRMERYLNVFNYNKPELYFG